MKQYLDILRNVLEHGTIKDNRTGIQTKSVTGQMFEHDMSKGFPLLTTKFVSLKNVAVELEGFIKGVTSKRWFQERGCHIWDDWCNPKRVPYGNDEKTKAKMKANDDLGKIYGSQWRCFKNPEALEDDGVDQLSIIIDTLKKDPTNRRMICTAWNPQALSSQALPPCHYSWQVLSDGNTLDLLWNQRSCDVPLGIPYNIASYALLLKLLAKEVNMKEGKLIGFLADTHIYLNQIEGVKEQLGREPLELCEVNITNTTGILNWTYKDLEIKNYNHLGKITFPLAV